MEKDREDALAKRVGLAIAQRRRLLPMTQEELAEALQCGVEAVSRMERGAIMPTLPRIIETAQALGCPVHELLGLTSDLPGDQAIEIARKLERVSANDREMLLALLDQLTDRLQVQK